jgi:predicted Zn-dependent peptidase
MQKPLSAARLAAAKRQIKGQIAIACDNRENFALDFGRNFLHNGTEKDLSTLFARIDAVTADDLLQVARQLFQPEHIVTLIYQ